MQLYPVLQKQGAQKIVQGRVEFGSLSLFTFSTLRFLSETTARLAPRTVSSFFTLSYLLFLIRRLLAVPTLP
jgi:hypothetical protein